MGLVPVLGEILPFLGGSNKPTSGARPLSGRAFARLPPPPQGIRSNKIVLAQLDKNDSADLGQRQAARPSGQGPDGRGALSSGRERSQQGAGRCQREERENGEGAVDGTAQPDQTLRGPWP
jgi:hypothetical protein